MSTIESLSDRINAEFDSAKKRVAEFQQEQVKEYQDRQQRLQSFSELCERLGAIWKPRLEALADRFGDKVDVKPIVKPALRQATFHFQSQLAKIVLSFSATTDADVRNLVLRYELSILPILMQFKASDRLEMPLDAIDEEALGTWIDDRIVDFVRSYLALHENQNYLNYLKHYMVEDPIAGVRFPIYVAATTCEWNGQTHYFIGEETCREFRASHGIPD